MPFALVAIPAAAQDRPEPSPQAEPRASEDAAAKEPRRYRVGLGAQLVPSFPGADSFSVRPLVDLSIARGSTPFAFEAPDESFGFSLVRSGDFAFGPAVNFEGKRTPGNLGAALAKVSTTIEAGGFVQYRLSEQLRVRAEARRGIGGHDGWTGMVGADYVTRNGDQMLFSIGPRLTFSDRTYHRAYFGVTPQESAATGLAAFNPGGGLQAVGATAGLITQFDRRWGLYSYAKYDRLVGDAADSPVVRGFGSRNQFSGGLALTYTFGGR